MFGLFVSSAAWAASLDLLEVGGAFGTPAASNATAVFWNPAGLAVADGTEVFLEVAPTFATVRYDRDHPYWGGETTLHFNGVVPYVGAASDFGYKPLGVGMALSVPFARGGVAGDDGPSRFLVEEGGSQTLFGTIGAAYDILGIVAVGGSFSLVHSQWTAKLDSATAPDLDEAMCENGICGTFEDIPATPDGDIDYWTEHENYATQLEFGDLTTNTYTFGAGVYATPIDLVGVSVSYMHGGTLAHEGSIEMQTACPSNDPDDENYHPDGYVISDLVGTCNTHLAGDATITYKMPWRLNGGVVLQPAPLGLRVEAMGGYVAWKVYDDYQIDIVTDPNSLDFETEEERADVAELTTKHRLWARGNESSFWAGLDGKKSLLLGKLTVGGRVTYDHRAVPDAFLSPNNYDSSTVILSGMAAVTPLKPLTVGASFSRHVVLPRTIDDSAYGLTMDPEKKKEDRLFYASSNGTYKAGINRIGIMVRGRFGAGKTTE